MIASDEIKSKIEEYWDNHKHCTVVKRYASAELFSFLEKQLEKYPWFESTYNVLSFAVKGCYEPVKCQTCGKVLKLYNAREGKIYCSGKCAANSSVVREKSKATMKSKYGCEYSAQNDKIRKKQRATMLEKYGAEYTLSSDILSTKVGNTLMEKYGVDCIGKSQEAHEHAKTTSIAKYGFSSYSKTDEFKNKSSKQNREKGYALLERWKNHVVPLFGKEEYEGLQGIHYGKKYKWKCVKCGNEFEFESHSTGIHEELGKCFPACPQCHRISSFKEGEFSDFIKSIFNGEVLERKRDVIPPYELDIYLPDKKIAFEFNGLYWHSEEKGKEECYHSNKTDMCLVKGITLVQVFEDEWAFNNEIVKDRIRSLLSTGQKRLFARKCALKELSSKESNDFLDENHLQGHDNAKYRYGLFHNGELLAVMTFGKPRFSKKYDYELIRYCSKIGIHIAGGASKMLSHFRRNHEGSIVSYADRRYSVGNLYEVLGFVKKGVSQPNYWWCKSKIKLSRYKCRKHLLRKILGNGFNPETSECENMKCNGFYRVYDCGNIVYVYEENNK